MERRPIALIQVDLDGLWAVRRCYGLSGTAEDEDPVFREALPVLLQVFDALNLRVTFFVVGADCRVDWKRRALASVLECGHEIANHSMTHNLGFARMPATLIEREVESCGKILRQTLDIEPRGFRAPGYGFSPALWEILPGRGIEYDASLLPTPWGWALRAVDRLISTRSTGPKTQYGTIGGARAPRVPFQPHRNGRTAAPGLWEIPVSVSPGLRLPFHGAMGCMLGETATARAIERLRRKTGFLNYVLHGMDLVDGAKWKVTAGRWGRRFFAVDPRQRREFFESMLERIAGSFTVMRSDEWILRARKVVEND
jgi:hypothetical protein